jgi:hypothetical protein
MGAGGFPGHRNSVKSTDVVHHRIQQGTFFTVSVGNLALANDVSLDCLVLTPPDPPEIHFRPLVKTGGDSEMNLFEDTIVSDNGIPTLGVNQNRKSSLVTSVAIFSGPTITDDGELLTQEFIPGGTGGGTSQGGEGGFYVEFILKPSSLYLMRLTNRAGTTQPVSMILQYYETFGLDLG